MTKFFRLNRKWQLMFIYFFSSSENALAGPETRDAPPPVARKPLFRPQNVAKTAQQLKESLSGRAEEYIEGTVH